VELRTLADVERYLNGFLNLERTRVFDYEKLGLVRIRTLLEAEDSPQTRLSCIHVAGSKGKGSMALAAECLLLAAGRRVGTYSSPHLESWRERFRIDGEPVAESALVETLRRMVPAIERQRRDPDLRPSFFDVSTALAFVLFRDLGVNAAVVEVGLGGRLDSTNVVVPRVCVITSLELEHTDKLGDTLEAIALEKAGILKSRVPLLHGPLPGEAMAAVAARAIAEDSPLDEVRPARVEIGEAGLEVRIADGRTLRAPVLGAHQATNLALAVRAVETFLERPLQTSELAALERLELPARQERIRLRQGCDAIVDSAHTPESARALRSSLESVWPDRGRVLMLSISKDKDAAGVLQQLAPSARLAVVARAEPTRSLDPEHLAMLAWASGLEQVEERETPAAALETALAALRPGELLVVAGSFYFAGAVRSLLRAEGVDSPA
jgi:dihydrofolate synthase/folylpolyglutamate synthase